MPKRTREYNSWRLEKLTNPETAAAYLTAAITDSPDLFRKALRNVAQARQMAKVAREAGVTRESLYRATSGIGNPTLDTLDAVLGAVGIKIIFAANRESLNSTPPQTIAGTGEPALVKTVSATETSGFRFGSINLTEVKEAWQGIGNSAIVNLRETTGESFNSTFQPTQGNEEPWLQKILLPHNPEPPLILEGQMISPLGMPTTCNLSQVYGT
jgi:probable addiction module antidote protein